MHYLPNNHKVGLFSETAAAAAVECRFYRITNNQRLFPDPVGRPRTGNPTRRQTDPGHQENGSTSTLVTPGGTPETHGPGQEDTWWSKDNCECEELSGGGLAEW